MFVRVCSFVFATASLSVTLAGCSVETSGEPGVASSEDELRALAPTEIVGSIAYGETKNGIAYDDSRRYRALSFDGRAGDEIVVTVSAGSADARAWLLSSNFRTLKLNDDASPGVRDASIRLRLTRSGTHYIAFREKNYEDATFSVSLARAGAPSSPAPSNDPWDEASCNGAPHPNPASLFAPGSTARELGRTVASWQTRQCNPVTGCTPWTNAGSSLAGVQYEGTAQLEVRGTGIGLTFEGSVINTSEETKVASCLLTGSEIACAPQNYLSTQYITLNGTVRGSCLRITGEHQTRHPGTGQYDGREYRLAMVVRY